MPKPAQTLTIETLIIISVCFVFYLSGEPCRIRTCDPLIKSQLLYQLS